MVQGRRALGAVVGLVIAIAIAYHVVDEPSLGIAFLYAIPVALAAFRFGRTGSLAVAGAALALFVTDELIWRSPELAGGRLITAAVSRAIVLVGIALLVSELLRRQREATSRATAAELEMVELGALRDALTPPDLPSFPFLEVATAFHPADGAVAGDFYLLVAGREPGLAIAIVGDVVGHGLHAARRAAFTRATLETFVGFNEDPVELMRLANVALQNRPGDGHDFATVICARIDAGRGEITWARAGHPPPLRLDSAEELPSAGGGPPLGIAESFGGTAMTATLDPGDGVLLYSDGLPEARSATAIDGSRRPLGEVRVTDEVRRHRGEAVGDVVDGLRAMALAHAGGALADDLTMMAIRLRPVTATP